MSVSDVAAVAPWSFLVGAVGGFVVGARYRISKRKDDD
jgi:hypothetical protein